MSLSASPAAAFGRLLSRWPARWLRSWPLLNSLILVGTDVITRSCGRRQLVSVIAAGFWSSRRTPSGPTLRVELRLRQEVGFGGPLACPGHRRPLLGVFFLIIIIILGHNIILAREGETPRSRRLCQRFQRRSWDGGIRLSTPRLLAGDSGARRLRPRRRQCLRRPPPLRGPQPYVRPILGKVALRGEVADPRRPSNRPSLQCCSPG